jgi:hypothetical protein
MRLLAHPTTSIITLFISSFTKLIDRLIAAAQSVGYAARATARRKDENGQSAALPPSRASPD